jgi:hypothetical protein
VLSKFQFITFLEVSKLIVLEMPLYDGIGMIAEKNAVVIDIGSAFTKVGYAGESAPRAIVRSPNLMSVVDKPTLNDVLVGFVHKLYFEHLLLNPKDRRVVLVEALIGDTRSVGLGLCPIQKMTESLFKLRMRMDQKGS